MRLAGLDMSLGLKWVRCKWPRSQVSTHQDTAICHCSLCRCLVLGILGLVEEEAEAPLLLEFLGTRMGNIQWKPEILRSSWLVRCSALLR